MLVVLILTSQCKPGYTRLNVPMPMMADTPLIVPYSSPVLYVNVNVWGRTSPQVKCNNCRLLYLDSHSVLVWMFGGGLTHCGPTLTHYEMKPHSSEAAEADLEVC